MPDPNYRKKKPKDLYECENGHVTIVRHGSDRVSDNCACGAENNLVVENERRPQEHR